MFTEQQVLELDEIGKVVTIASTILMVPLVFVNLWRQDRRQYPSRATTMYMLCVLGLHMTVLVGLLDADRTTFLEFYETGLVSKFCLVQGIVDQFFACGTLWLWLLICGILHAVIVKGTSFYDLEKLEWYHHATWLGLPPPNRDPFLYVLVGATDRCPSLLDVITKPLFSEILFFLAGNGASIIDWSDFHVWNH